MLYTSRRSEGGIAPVSGTGDRGFESRRFDQVKEDISSWYIFFCFIEQGTRRGNGTEWTSGGRPRPWKTECAVRTRIESRRFDHQGIIRTVKCLMVPFSYSFGTLTPRGSPTARFYSHYSSLRKSSLL